MAASSPCEPVIQSKSATLTAPRPNSPSKTKPYFLCLIRSLKAEPEPIRPLELAFPEIQKQKYEVKIEGYPFSEAPFLVRFLRYDAAKNLIRDYACSIAQPYAPRESGVFEKISELDVWDAMCRLPLSELKELYSELHLVYSKSSSQKLRHEAARICWTLVLMRSSGRVLFGKLQDEQEGCEQLDTLTAQK